MQIKTKTNILYRIRGIWDKQDCLDKYTVTFDYFNRETDTWEPSMHDRRAFACLCLSDNHDSPQGFNQWSSCAEGDHLGTRIYPDHHNPKPDHSVPAHLLKAIEARLNG